MKKTTLHGVVFQKTRTLPHRSGKTKPNSLMISKTERPICNKKARRRYGNLPEYDAGAFTPTEAAAVSAVYAFFIEMFIYQGT